MAETAVAKKGVTWAIRRAAMQVKQARKNLYYRVRETSGGHALLQAAEFIRSPLDHRARRSVAQEYLARTTPPLMEPAKGYGLTSVDTFENFDAVVAGARALFETKRAEI